MKVTLENGDVLELGSECEFSSNGKTWVIGVLDTVRQKNRYAYVDESSESWEYCRPIRKREMKEVPMSAVEVAEICKANWVRFPALDVATFGARIDFRSESDIAVDGYDSCDCTYAPTPDAPESEWKRFTKMVEVDG